MTRFLPADINQLRDAVGEALMAEEPMEVLAGGSKHGLGRPMQTALAPIHSALTMSEPRRKPLSTMIGMRPFTASTISGSASMVERPESSLRAPWLDTMIASMPLSAAITASSQARMPLITIFILVVSRSRLKKSQVIAEDCVLVSPERSNP